MGNNVLRRMQGKSIRDMCLFLNDLIVRKKRQLLYSVHLKTDRTFERNAIHIPDIDDDVTDEDMLLADLYCDHIFDLLGSGPQLLSRKHNSIATSEACSNAANKRETESIIYSLNESYDLIEWQIDFKNNYLFDGFIRSELIPNNESSGYEIKIPWELSRCQHLPFLARVYKKTNIEKYRIEILCEILDFIANNPVGYGVNWKCTMDVAIRISNWIMALDIIWDRINEEIEAVVSRAIYQHCIFVRYHLEDQRDYRGNHYLSDIVGLIFASTYFRPEGMMRNIQDFAIKRFLNSIDEQFYIDGGNFESSLPYHRLGLELVIFGLWRIFALAENNDLCRKYKDYIETLHYTIEKIGKAFRMMLDATKPSGDIYQLGDNDSGHLFRFFHFGKFLTDKEYIQLYGHTAKFENVIWDENELCNKEILLLICSILNLDDSRDKLPLRSFIGDIFSASKVIAILKDSYEKGGKEYSQVKEDVDITQFPYTKEKEIVFEIPVDLTEIKSFYYPHFGLVGLKSKDFYLGVSITDVGQNGRGGHSHNDKLSYDLYANGFDYERDPGSYVYTESKEWRNRFRSSLAHNSPYFGDEQNVIGENCFELKQRTKSTLIELSNKTIQVSCKYEGVYVIRRFELKENKLLVSDYSNREFVEHQVFNYFSNGYGKKYITQKENENG